MHCFALDCSLLLIFFFIFVKIAQTAGLGSCEPVQSRNRLHRQPHLVVSFFLFAIYLIII